MSRSWAELFGEDEPPSEEEQEDRKGWLGRLRESLAGSRQALEALYVEIRELARQRGLTAHVLDLRNSGDTAGDRERVVGYGAFAFTEPPCG